MSTQNNQAVNIASRSLWQDAQQRFMKNRAAQISLFTLFLVAIFVIFVPLLSPFAYDQTNWDMISTPPSLLYGHYFGTDALGRDLLVRLAIGGRASLMVGLIGATVAVFMGTLYGTVSGYIGGTLDNFMMRLVEILNAFPFMFFLIILVSIFGQNIFLIFIAIGMIAWLDVARIVRCQTISLKEKEFIEAAQVTGSSSIRIIIRHIVPNILGTVVVHASLLVPAMILAESFLSYLGLGVQEPMSSWGGLLKEGAEVMEAAPFQLIFPAILLIITLFCFNFIGDGLRDAFDPKDR